MSRPAGSAHRITTNAASQLATLLLAAGANLVAIPVLIDGLGPEAYGLLVLVLAYVGFFDAIAAGVQLALVRELHSTTRDQEAAAREVLRAGVFVGVAFGAFAAAVTLLLAPWVATPLSGSAFAGSDLGWTLACWCALVLVTRSANFAFSAPLVAAERIDLLNAIRCGFELLRVCGLVLVLARGHDLRAVLLVFLVTNVLDCATTASVATRFAPAGWRRPVPSMRRLRALGPFWRSTIVANLSAWAHLEMDKFVVSIFLPLSRLPFYQVPFGLTQRIGLVATSIGTAVFPAVSLRVSGDSGGGVRRLYLSSSKAVAVLTILPTVFVFVYAHELLRLWIGPEFALQSAQPLRMFAIGFVLNSLGRLPAFTCQAVGHPEVAARFAVANAVLSTVLLVLFLPRFGITGGATAFAVAQALIIPQLVRRTGALVGVRSADWFREVLARVGLLGAGLGVLLEVSKAWTGSPYASVPSAFLGTLLYLVVVERWVLSAEERRIVYELLPSGLRARFRS